MLASCAKAASYTCFKSIMVVCAQLDKATLDKAQTNTVFA
jgi:hypothetical protein